MPNNVSCPDCGRYVKNALGVEAHKASGQCVRPTITHETALPRFLAKVNKTEACWLWTGAQLTNGYGSFRFAGRAVLPHRFSYEAHVGPIPDGLTLDHLCRMPLCVNPAHLEPVTHRVNVLRGTGMSARNAKKTHCPRGHELSGNNLMKGTHGRQCKACSYARLRTLYATNAAFRERMIERARRQREENPNHYAKRRARYANDHTYREQLLARRRQQYAERKRA